MYFQTRLNFRVRGRELAHIERILADKPEKYENLSHFVRCAVIKLLKEEDRNTPLKSENL